MMRTKDKTLTHKLIRTGLLLLLPLLAACNLVTTAPQDNPTQQPSDNGGAANGDWFAYIYNPQRDEMLKISADGAQATYSFGFDTNNYVSSYAMSFNEDGSRAAYCQTIYQPESPVSSATLYVRDIAAQTTIVTVDLGSGPSKACTMGREGFVGNQIAVGVMNYAPFGENIDTSQPVWEVIVFDATTGERVSSINSDANPVTFDDPQQAEFLTFPLLLNFTGADVIFTLMPFASEGLLDAPAFGWNVASGAVGTVDYWGKAGISESSTGELAFPDNDPNLPAGAPMGPIGVFNVLRLVDGGAARTIYHSPDWLIANTIFINNGQQIAMMQYPSFNPDEPIPSFVSRWMAIDRAGNVSELLTSTGYAQMLPAPDGYVVMEQTHPTADIQQGHYTVTLVQNGTSTVLFEMDVTDNTTYELAWASPMATASDLGAFPTLSQ
jgi:hypothetical protein